MEQKLINGKIFDSLGTILFKVSSKVVNLDNENDIEYKEIEEECLDLSVFDIEQNEKLVVYHNFCYF
jgi:hypothetical protein